MRPLTYELGPYAAGNATAIAVAQAVTAGVPMTLTSDPYVSDVPRTVLITSVGDESGNRFLVVGEGPKGNQIAESITGANAGTAEGGKLFSEVHSITPEFDGAANVSAGTVTDVPTPWIPLDWVDVTFNVGVVLEIVGTVTTGALLQATMDDLGLNSDSLGNPFAIVAPIQNIADITNDVLGAATIGSSTRADGQLITPYTAIRALSQEALGAGELLRLQVLQGNM